MIDLHFKLNNPWSDRWDFLWSKHRMITKYKAWELGLYRTNSIVELYFHYRIRCDHAGVKFMFSLFGYTIELNLYDTRHWDYDNKTWGTYAESS
jgi:hypothetical protein